jgi:hypothetical protein
MRVKISSVVLATGVQREGRDVLGRVEGVRKREDGHLRVHLAAMGRLGHGHLEQGRLRIAHATHDDAVLPAEGMPQALLLVLRVSHEHGLGFHDHRHRLVAHYHVVHRR